MKTQKSETWTESIPEFWLCYLINGDTDNITESEIDEIKEFESAMLDGLKGSLIISPKYENDYLETYFEYNYFINLGCTCCEVYVTVIQN